MMLEDIKNSKAPELQVEKYEYASDGEAGPEKTIHESAMGTVTITDSSEIFLVPAPSADPRGLFIP